MVVPIRTAQKIKSFFIFRFLNRGFTLVEMIMVITVIAVLAGIAIPRISNQGEKAATAEAISAIGAIDRAEARFLDENNIYWELNGSEASPTDVCLNLDAANQALGINLRDICKNTGPRWQYWIVWLAVGRIRIRADRLASNTAGSLVFDPKTRTTPAVWSGTGDFARGRKYWPFGEGY